MIRQTSSEPSHHRRTYIRALLNVKHYIIHTLEINSQSK